MSNLPNFHSSSGVDVIRAHILFPTDGQGTANAFVELYFDGHLMMMSNLNAFTFWVSSSTSEIHLDFTISLLKLIVTTDLLMAVPSLARYLSQLPLLFLILMMLFFTSPMENRGISSPVRGEIGLKVYIPNEASLKSYAAAPTHPDNLDPTQPTSTY